MTKTLKAGDTYVALKAGFIWAGAVRARGERIVVTSEDSPEKLAVVLDVNAQVARWGEQRLAVELPEHFEHFEQGTVERDLEYQRRRAEAYAQPVERLRDEALRKLTADFGMPPATSRTLTGPTDASLEQYRARQRAMDAQQPQRAFRGELDAELERSMDVARSVSFDRALERQQILDDGATP